MKIKVPATSANLGVGFDCLGAAFDIYNEFEFVLSDKYSLENFPSYISEDDNLVLKAYKRFLKKYDFHIKDYPVVIRLLEQNIPISRGLGSSASCIVAGVLAANALTKKNLSLEECSTLMADIEGHPDNVYAAAFGGVITVFKDDKYYSHSFNVNDDYKFYVCVSDQLASTTLLRESLPETVELSDAVFNLSRGLQLDTAFKGRDISFLSKVLQDKLHQQYRAKFIPKFAEFCEVVEKEDGILLISGSGSSLLIISKKDISIELPNYQIMKVKLSKGAYICE